MTRIARLITATAATAALLLSGCTAETRSGVAVRDPGVATTGTAAPGSGSVESTATADTEPCDDITHADPTIAFEPSLRDGDEMSVGDTSWLSSVNEVSEVEVSGDAGVVELDEKTSPTTIACGEVTSTVSWIEVRAGEPGEVTFTLSDGDTLTVTVVA